MFVVLLLFVIWCALWFVACCSVIVVCCVLFLSLLFVGRL